MTHTIINALIIPAIMLAAILGFVAGNQHGERYGAVAGRESAENDVLQLHMWTQRSLAANDVKGK